jgi:hypothetical protein
MSTTVNFNITDLRLKDQRLYKDVIAGIGVGELHGDISLNSKSWYEIPYDVRAKLTLYLQSVNPDPKAHVKTAEDEPHSKDCSCNDCFQAKTREQMRAEAARLEIEKQNLPGQRRINEYMTQGYVFPDGRKLLLDNAHNRDAFWNFLDAKFPGLRVITPQHVDVFIQAKREELEWAAPQPVPTPVSAQPEPVVTLSDGSSQLPIDTVPVGPHLLKYTIPQLRDLTARQRARDAGETEALPPLEYIQKGRTIVEPRVPLSVKPGPQHSPEQHRDWNVRIANAHAKARGSHGGGGASWFDSRRL